MEFIYNDKKISTLDEIKISVADLRDLIQAGELLAVNEEQAIAEYRLIVEGILRKNRLPVGTVLVNPATEW